LVRGFFVFSSYIRILLDGTALIPNPSPAGRRAQDGALLLNIVYFACYLLQNGIYIRFNFFIPESNEPYVVVLYKFLSPLILFSLIIVNRSI